MLEENFFVPVERNVSEFKTLNLKQRTSTRQCNCDKLEVNQSLIISESSINKAVGLISVCENLWNTTTQWEESMYLER